jgi:hypothetical protein
MKRILTAYRELLGILFAEIPFVVRVPMQDKYIGIFIKGVALLGFNTPPLGALFAGGAGDLFPRYAKISRRNLRYRGASPAVFHFLAHFRPAGPETGLSAAIPCAFPGRAFFPQNLPLFFL